MRSAFLRRESVINSLIVSVALVISLSPVFAGQPLRVSSQNGQQKPTADEILTNRGILDMLKGGLSSEIIIAKIQSSQCNFDTSPAALNEMKTAGTSDAVILAMVKAEKPRDKNGIPTIPMSQPSQSGKSDASSREQTKGVIHFYRERAYVGSLRKMPIYVDEIKIADLVNGRFFTTELDPGKHVFRCQTKVEAIEVQIEPGKEYYLRAEIMQSFTKNHWRMV